VSTSEACAEELAALGNQRGDVVALGDAVSGLTCSEPFAFAHPDRCFDMFGSQRQRIAAAVGMRLRDWIPFTATVPDRISGAQDLVRTVAASGADLRLIGTQPAGCDAEHARSPAGPDDFASMRAVHASAVLHPSDANQTAALIAQMAGRSGVSYLRALRQDTVVRTGRDEDIRIGGSRLVRASDDDSVAVVACGETVGEAEQAANLLEHEGVRVRVIDCYSIKPIDRDTLRSSAQQAEVMLTVECHRPEGGLGEAVLAALADQPGCPPILRLAVRDVPGPAARGDGPDALGIGADSIARALRAHLAAAAGPGGAALPHLSSRVARARA
jgi:transketolase